MHRSFHALAISVLIVAVTSLSLSCKKRRNNQTHSSEDIAVGQSLIAELIKTSHQFIIFSQFVNGQQEPVLDTTLNYCFDFDAVPDRSAPNDRWPRTISIDFNDRCDALDGHERSGLVEVELTNWWDNTDTQTTITAKNYTVNGNQVSGTIVLTYLTYAGGQVLQESADISVLATTGSFFQLKTTCKRTLAQGYASRTVIGNDLWVITGDMEGVNSNGDAFSATILEPLIYENGCPFVTEGSVEVYPSGLDMRTLDFGQGNCDADFSVGVDGRFFHLEAENF